MSAAIDRKLSYKLPPTTITDKLISQESRRSKALEEQKRRRAQRVDSSRQLDLFADLNLGSSDEEDVVHSNKGVKEVSLASVAPYAAMLDGNIASDTIAHDKAPKFSIQGSSNDGSRKQKKKRKNKNSKNNKWANKCMYAELLEMASDGPWSTLNSSNDGLPSDIETGWVAVGPVPVGKRCLAVTHQSSGIASVVPNTTLRSRLLGKVLIQRFPSNLPPLTILDCILDSNWRENGILHVLDVVKWKGQDVGDCETPFRFWWRDTRLAELIQSPPPAVASVSPSILNDQSQYRFPYPTTFIPVPYHTDTTLLVLSSQIIPFARSSRSITVEIPAIQSTSPPEGIMDVDPSLQLSTPLVSIRTSVPSDGLLLYVAEASYEAGTSPLSSWIPITSYDEDHSKDKTQAGSAGGPLDLFQSLVERRLRCGESQIPRAEFMDMDL